MSEKGKISAAQGVQDEEIVHANETISTKPEASWVSLFSHNCRASNGITLNYIPPEIIEGNITVKIR